MRIAVPAARLKEIWDYLLTDIEKAGSIGKLLKDDVGPSYDLLNAYLDAKVSPKKFSPYVASDDLLLSSDAEVTFTNTAYEKKKENLVLDGEYRIKFDIKTNNAPYATYAIIYKNDVEAGTARSTTSETYVTFSEDISGFSDGDLEQIYAKVSEYGDGALQNHRVYGEPMSLGVVT